jgi:hypothetical protein
MIGADDDRDISAVHSSETAEFAASKGDAAAHLIKANLHVAHSLHAIEATHHTIARGL